MSKKQRFKQRSSLKEVDRISKGNITNIPESTMKSMKQDITAWRTNLKKNTKTLRKHGWSISSFAERLIGNSSLKGKNDQEIANTWLNLYGLQLDTNLNYTQRKKKDEERIQELKNPRLREMITTAEDYEKFSEFEASVRDLWTSMDVDSDDVAEWYVNEVKAGTNETDTLVSAFEEWLDNNGRTRFLRY